MRYLIYLIPYSFFEACEMTAIGSWVAQSTYAFALIETLHIIALAVLLGTMVVVDVRLLGVNSRWHAPAELARELAPWTVVSLVLMFATGISMFLSEATRLSRNAPFYYKIVFLILAVVLHFAVYWKVTSAQHGEFSLSWKLVASLSLTSWFLVALAGRAIAFL
jgi:hypothetical protein